jgi:DNA-binding transcriptional MerR regulator
MKEIFLGFLGKTLNMPIEQIAELLYQKSDDGTTTDEPAADALAQLLALDAERVNRIKPNTKEFFDNGYKKAESEVSAKWEKTLREKFGVDTEGKLQGDALADAIKAAMADAGTKPEKVKVHPEYLALEANMRKTLAEKEAEFNAKVEQIKTEANREKTWSNVSNEIRKSLLELNPVLPGDQAKAARVVDLFLSEFKGYEFEPDTEGGFIPMKDGQRVQDKHLYPRKLSDLVKEMAEGMFDFKAQEEAGNAGNKNQPGKKTVNQRFKSEGEFLEAYNQEPDFAAKEALYQAYNAQTAN